MINLARADRAAASDGLRLRCGAVRSFRQSSRVRVLTVFVALSSTPRQHRSPTVATRPGDDDADGLGGFVIAEAAKRRLLFELAYLGLPIEGYRERENGLAFDLPSTAAEMVLTGHADGVITLGLDETDPAHRERMRITLGEPYRTVLGHMRHEVAHYYQPIVAAPGSDDERRCREVFGDERADYQIRQRWTPTTTGARPAAGSSRT